MPQGWGDCSQDQIERLLPLQLTDLSNQDALGRGRLKGLALKALLPQLDKYSQDLTEDQWFSLSRLTEWVWEDRITARPFDSFTVKVPLSKGAFRLDTFILPDDNFTNTTAIEVAMANINFIAFTRPDNPDRSAVYKLLATLCRPARKDLKKFKASPQWNGDRREEYNTVLADERAELFGRLPIGTVMAVTQYFEAMNDRFLKMYPDVYEADPNAEAEPPMYKNGEGLVTTLMDIGREGVFGDFDKVCSQNCHSVWLYLKDNSKKIKRANARAERERLINIQ